MGSTWHPVPKAGWCSQNLFRPTLVQKLKTYQQRKSYFCNVLGAQSWVISATIQNALFVQLFHFVAVLRRCCTFGPLPKAPKYFFLEHCWSPPPKSHHFYQVFK